MKKMIFSVTPPDLRLLISFLNADLRRVYPKPGKATKNTLDHLLVGFEQEIASEFGKKIYRSARGEQRDKIVVRLGEQKAIETQTELRNILRGVLENHRSSWSQLASRIAAAGTFTYELAGPSTIVRCGVPPGTASLYQIIIESVEADRFKTLRICKQCEKFFLARHLSLKFCRRVCYDRFFAADAARRMRKSREPKPVRFKPFRKG